MWHQSHTINAMVFGCYTSVALFCDESSRALTILEKFGAVLRSWSMNGFMNIHGIGHLKCKMKAIPLFWIALLYGAQQH